MAISPETRTIKRNQSAIARGGRDKIIYPRSPDQIFLPRNTIIFVCLRQSYVPKNASLSLTYNQSPFFVFRIFTTMPTDNFKSV